MLGMLINTSMPWAPSPWKSWVDHIEDKKSTFGFQKAALFHDNGAVASATRGFSLTPREVKVSYIQINILLKHYFQTWLGIIVYVHIPSIEISF